MAIRRLDLFREVLRRIERYIDSNGLGVGDRLPSDRELARVLGVSRPLVRQALKVLEGLGRVTAHQGSGTFVQNANHAVALNELVRGLRLDRRLLEDLVQARIAIETAVMREAFVNRTPERLALLERGLEESADQLIEDSSGASLNLVFEAGLGQVCGNEILRRLQGLVHDLWLQVELELGVAPRDNVALHREHIQIFDRFQRGDLGESLRLFEQHLDFLRADESSASRTTHEHA